MIWASALIRKKNKRSSDEIAEVHTEKSRTKILVIPTDEEFEIAVQTKRLIVGEENRNHHA